MHGFRDGKNTLRKSTNSIFFGSPNTINSGDKVKRREMNQNTFTIFNVELDFCDVNKPYKKIDQVI